MSSKIIKNSRNTKDAPKSVVSTQTVAFSHYNNISAQLPIDPKSGKVVNGGIKEQTKQCLTNLKAIIESISHTMSDVARINIFLRNIMDLEAVNEVYKTFFASFPTRVAIAVADLPMKDALIQMDAVITNGEGTKPQAPCDLIKMTRNTAKAPISSIYAQSVAFSHYSHVAGQLPICPKSGIVVEGGIKAQTKQCLQNIKNILEEIEVPLDDIVKVNIYLKNLSDLDAVNEVYKTFFPDSAIARTVGYLPARSVIAAKDLPMHALVEIDATVSHGDGTPPQIVEDRHGIVIRANNTKNAPICPNSTQTVAFSHYNNVSGQLPIDAKTGKIVGKNAQEQAEQCLKNIQAIVESVDHVMDDIVKINIQLKNMDDLEAVDKIYPSFFKGDLPARTVIGVSQIPMNALVQIDAILSNAEGTPPQK